MPESLLKREQWEKILNSSTSEKRDLNSDTCQIPNSSFQSEWNNLKWNEADWFQKRFSHMSYSATVIAMYFYSVLVRINLQAQTSHSIRLEQIAKPFNKDLQWHL